jgi:hypothetical protein
MSKSSKQGIVKGKTFNFLKEGSRMCKGGRVKTTKNGKGKQTKLTRIATEFMDLPLSQADKCHLALLIEGRMKNKRLVIKPAALQPNIKTTN